MAASPRRAVPQHATQLAIRQGHAVAKVAVVPSSSLGRGIGILFRVVSSGPRCVAGGRKGRAVRIMTSVMVFWLGDAIQRRRFFLAVRRLRQWGVSFRIAEWDDGFTRLLIEEN